MAQRILQVNFKLPENMDLNSPEGQQTMQEWVQHNAEFPGLKWKIWIRNEATGELGGIYLFEDEQSLRKYLDGKTISQVSKMPDVSIKEFEIEAEPTQMTRGPVGQAKS